MEIEQQIGYLVAKVEELAVDSKEMKVKLDALQVRVDEKLKTAELIAKGIKYLGLALIAILTFKFGDLKSLWPF